MIGKKAILVEYKKSGLPAILINFEFNSKTIAQVNTIPNRKFHKSESYWSAPFSIEAVDLLLSFGFQLDEPLQAFYLKAKQPHFKTFKIKNFLANLYPYQNDGVGLINKNNGRALLADEPGLGKTLQALGWTMLQADKKPVLIVVPGNLKLHWKKTIKTFCKGVSVSVIRSSTPDRDLLQADYVIINYEVLANTFEPFIDLDGRKCENEIRYTGWIDFLLEIKWQVLIIDEAHFIKNDEAKRTQAVMRLGKYPEHVIVITGTPIENRHKELFNLIKLAHPGLFPNKFRFLHKYCDPKKKFGHWDFSGSSNGAELFKILTETGVLIRRLKKDVMPELPPKTRIVEPLEIDNRFEYNAAFKNFIPYIREMRGNKVANKYERAEALTKLTVLQQLATKGKLNAVIDWIDNFLEKGQKLVVFCTHKSTSELIYKRFKKISVLLDGSTPAHERQSIVDTFQESEKIKLFIGILDNKGRPSGVGITLTAACTTATVELQLSPAVHTQADQRVHRIGTKEPVFNYYLMAENTIEEKICALLDKKQKIADTVIDGKETDSSDLFMELINSL